jgi:hypothetical protein
VLYLGHGRLKIGDETKCFTGQELLVLEAIVELQAATKRQLEARSGVGEAVRVLKRMVDKHPELQDYIIARPGRNKGGYRTTIQRAGV